MNIPRMQEFIQANLTALLGLNKPSADGFAPAITREQLKSALAQSIERVEQELNGVPNPIVGIVEDIDANGVAKIRVTSMGGRITPEEKISFTVTDGPTLPWPTPYRSFDADFRTSSEEWKQSLRGRDLRWIEGVLP